MSHLQRIYAPWGGNAEQMANTIGERPVTVRQWRNRGRIPERYWRKIIAHAAERGVPLTADDFLPDDDVHDGEGTSQVQQASCGSETIISAHADTGSAAGAHPDTAVAEGEGATRSLPGGPAA